MPKLATKKPRIAVYPGSFDPITIGHVDIVERVAKMFDRVIVLVAVSSEKATLFSVDEKMELIRQVFAKRKNISVDSWQGLTVDYVRQQGAQVIARGLRAVVDFEYEMAMAGMNKKLAPDIETVLVFASPEYYFISSRWIKEVAKNGGNLKGLVPSQVAVALKEKLSTRTKPVKTKQSKKK